MFAIKRRPEKSRVRVSIDQFDLMPEDTRLFVAHCLDRKDPNVEVLQWDKDVEPLVRIGWLIKEECDTKAVCKYHFHSAAWRKLNELHSLITGRVTRSRLDDYRQRKSLLYPWRW